MTACGGEHPAEVVGARLGPGQHDPVRPRPARSTALAASKHELTDGRARARRQAVGQRRASPPRVNVGWSRVVSWCAVDAGQRLVEVDDALVGELDRDAEGGGRAALAEPGLQDPQAAALHRELHVAEVAVVLLQGAQVP